MLDEDAREVRSPSALARSMLNAIRKAEPGNAADKAQLFFSFVLFFTISL